MKRPRINRALAVQYAQLVECAYHMFESDKRNPRPRPCSPFVAGYKFVTWVTMKDPLFNPTPNPPDLFYGMIAQSTTDLNKFVLAIRGTDTYQEMLQDLSAIWFERWDFGRVGFCFKKIYETMQIVLPVPIPIPPPGTFAHQVAAVVQHAAATTRGQSAKVGDISVVVTGHSLGAALGTLYVAQNVNHKLLTNPLICTFGSPLVGDSEFVRNFNRLRITSWRIVNGRPPRIPYDIITILPPDIFGFRHIKGEYRNEITADVVPAPVCWHHIKTYQHMLDARQPLCGDCNNRLARRSRRLPLKPIPH